MIKSLVSAALALGLASTPVLAAEDAAKAAVEAGPLAEGGPSAQLGIGEGALTSETALHVGGLLFVVVATGAILGGSGGGSDALPGSPTSSTN